ncbi:TIM barrel protein [Akkermansiaceae bacterium]|nr:TIM barrel protein [Akkermansiaceae bacterium]
MDRRSFVGKASLVGLGVLAGGKASAAEEKPGRDIAVFTKYLEKLSFDELAETIAPLGIAGLEAPLRKGGHIEPEEMEGKLPALVAALAKKDLEVTIMASSINQVDKAGLAENQLRAAAKSGIRRYRLEHLKYDLSKPIKPQVANFKAQLTDLAALNKEIGIQGLYQNHRGNNYVGGPIWDMVGMLEGIDVKDLGMAFDFAHATVEGANAWEMNFRRALPHIGAVYFKDYRIAGKQQQACPLGEGMVNPLAGKFVTKLLPPEIPVSIHIEYVKGGDVVKDTVAAMKNDLVTVRKWLG